MPDRSTDQDWKILRDIKELSCGIHKPAQRWPLAKTSLDLSLQPAAFQLACIEFCRKVYRNLKKMGWLLLGKR